MDIQNNTSEGLVGKTINLSTQELVELSDLRDNFIHAVHTLDDKKDKFNRRLQFESSEEMKEFVSRLDNSITFLAQITEGVKSTDEVKADLFGAPEGELQMGKRDDIQSLVKDEES